MSYELMSGDSLGENLRRICRKQIEGAIAVAQGGAEIDGSPVHETRKHLKKARAALRLVRSEIGKGLYRRQNRLLRDTARLISDLRDAEVRLQTVRHLETIAHCRKVAGGTIEATLLFELENFMAAFADWQSQAVPMLTEALAAVDCWAVDELDVPQLAAALQRSYKRARKTLAAAQANPSAECFHEFRSRAKVLWHQLRIIRPVNAVVLKNLSAELAAVGDLLGQAHDLNFLGERLRDKDGSAQWQREAEQLLGVARAGEGQLQRGATELGEHFFVERPRDFGNRIAEWLRNWEKDGAPSVAEELI